MPAAPIVEGLSLRPDRVGYHIENYNEIFEVRVQFMAAKLPFPDPNTARRV